MCAKWINEGRERDEWERTKHITHCCRFEKMQLQNMCNLVLSSGYVLLYAFPRCTMLIRAEKQERIEKWTGNASGNEISADSHAHCQPFNNFHDHPIFNKMYVLYEGVRVLILPFSSVKWFVHCHVTVCCIPFVLCFCVFQFG